MRKLWIDTAGWVGAGLAALSLAVASPTDSSVMGKLPFTLAKRADRQPVTLPADLPAHRTLVVVTFRRDQREDAERWIQGLDLRHTTGVRWVRMPVINAPPEGTALSEAEDRLFGHFDSHPDRQSVLAVFTDREAFLRRSGLTHHDRVHVLVLNREGDVLARAEGPYEAGRALALRETLLEDD
ncbi:MAG: hypothetical protein KA795_02900 [Burkholderiaceae bacterium]|nr:hypothetical protein [Burkholderiaceae bacterium]